LCEKHIDNFSETSNIYFNVKDISKPIDETRDVSICLDVLFHILDDIDFHNILINLINNTDKYIFIYTWSKNPFKSKCIPYLNKRVYNPFSKNKISDNVYQKYRDFKHYLKFFEVNNFKLLGSFFKNEIDDHGKMLVFGFEPYLDKNWK
jgi:hypothetical protein